MACNLVTPGERVVLHLSEGTPLSGRVTDASTGELLEGVRVIGTTRSLEPVRWNEATLTDAQGRFAFRAVPDEPLTVRYFLDGFQPHTEKDFLVVPGQPTQVDVSLVPGLPVTGWVLDAETGTPIQGASISAGYGLFEQKDLTETDASGRFTLRGVGRDKIVVRARATGYSPGQVHLDLRQQRGEVTVQIELERWSSVRGIVRSLDGKPISGAEVFLERDAFLFARKSERLAVTGNDGEFRVRLEDLDGVARMFATHPDYTTGYSQRFEAGPHLEGSTIEILLPEGATIRGTVFDETGSPLEGARVSLFDEVKLSENNPAYRPEAPFQHRPRGKMTHSVQSDRDGTFEIRGIVGGIKFLQVSSEGWLTQTVSGLQVGEGAVVGPLTIRLEKGRGIAGRVLDTSGTPVEGARVSVVRHAADVTGATGATVTDAEGEFVIENLAGGTYNLFATKSGFVRHEERGVAAGAQGVTITLEQYGAISGFIRFEAMAETILPGKFTVAIRPTGNEAAPLVRKSFSAEDGRFLVESVAPGVYDLVASADGFRTAVLPGVRVVQNDTTAGVEIVLDMGATIQGRVVDEAGNPVGDASVYARPSSPGGEALGAGSGGSASTGRDGVFTITGLEAGAYEVIAMSGKQATMQPVSVYLADRGHQVVDLVVGGAGELHVRITGPDGAPVSGADVQVIDESGSLVVNPRSLGLSAKYSSDPDVLRHALRKLNQTDVTGFLLISSIPPGKIEIRVEATDFHADRRRVEVVAGETTIVEITLEPR
jgi:protocatechuate 3,4-dioxygenase beta subunit